jgi:hypothetical protein
MRRVGAVFGCPSLQMGSVIELPEPCVLSAIPYLISVTISKYHLASDTAEGHQYPLGIQMNVRHQISVVQDSQPAAIRWRTWPNALFNSLFRKRFATNIST